MRDASKLDKVNAIERKKRITLKNKLVSGTFWLSAANMICKILGIVYLIPWLMFMGNYQDQHQAQALYNVAYLPYALFLSLGTAGFPSGIAKKIAELSHQKDQSRPRELFRSALAVMEVIGIISAILMFIFAPALSKISPVANQEAAIYAIRSLCPSLLIIPILSAIRGYFQGSNLIMPFGISQVIEQLVRVLVIIGGTYYIRVVAGGDILSAVVISTFASCVGGIVAIIYLVALGKRVGLFRLRDFFILPLHYVRKSKEVTLGIIKESLPFVYVGSVVSLMQLIDQVSLKPIIHFLKPIMSQAQLETLYTFASANPNKLTPLLLSIIGSITVTSLPLLSTLRRKEDLLTGISDTLRLSLTVLLPSSVGMILLSIPLNTIFFGYNLEGSMYLALAIAATFLTGIFTVLLSILQALNAHRKAIYFTTQVLFFKLICQVPLVYFFEGMGMSLASIASLIISVIGVYRFITKTFEIHPLSYVRRYYLKVLQATFAMEVVCILCFIGLSHILVMSSKIHSVIFVVCIALVGAMVFMGMVFGKNIKQLVLNFFHSS